MAKITYTNKVALSPQPSISAENKVTDADMNEIKTSVNTLYDNQGDLTSLTTTEKSNLVGAVNELKNAEVYSTTEVKTNKVWVDSNNVEHDVYRRRIEVNSTTTTGSPTNLVQVSYIDILTDFYVEVEAGGLLYLGSSPINFYFNESTKYIQEAHSDSWWNNKPIKITIEYTKTTD